jgi:hypothetical protein
MTLSIARRRNDYIFAVSCFYMLMLSSINLIVVMLSAMFYILMLNATKFIIFIVSVVVPIKWVKNYSNEGKLIFGGRHLVILMPSRKN